MKLTISIPLSTLLLLVLPSEEVEVSTSLQQPFRAPKKAGDRLDCILQTFVDRNQYLRFRQKSVGVF